MELEIRDHYYIRLRSGCFAVAVGNMHEPYMFIAYVKYCPARGETPWRLGPVFLERLVKVYDPSEVRRHTPSLAYVAHFDSYVPYVSPLEVAKVLNPVERARELVASPRDALEAKAAEAVGELWGSVGSEGVGITGSVLAKIHNPEVSDLDLAIYGVKSSLGVVEHIQENPGTWRPLPDWAMSAWARSNSALTGLSPTEVLKFYRGYRRGVYGGKPYSVIYNPGWTKTLANQPAFRTLARVVVSLEIEGSCSALEYPTKGVVGWWKVLKGPHPPYDISEVLSFEALYLPLFLEGGRAEAEGLLQCSSAGTCRVLVGGAELRGRVRWRG